MSESIIQSLSANVLRLGNECRDLHAENARLKAEVERLESMADENAHLHKGIYSLSINVVQLKDEVERLRKAGDAMVKRTEFFQKRWDVDELCQEVEAWNAAKEGKQP